MTPPGGGGEWGMPSDLYRSIRHDLPCLSAAIRPVSSVPHLSPQSPTAILHRPRNRPPPDRPRRSFHHRSPSPPPREAPGAAVFLDPGCFRTLATPPSFPLSPLCPLFLRPSRVHTKSQATETKAFPETAGWSFLAPLKTDTPHRYYLTGVPFCPLLGSTHAVCGPHMCHMSSKY